MASIPYKIEFFSYWHAGAGLSGGTYADMIVNKTREGFPYLPGRTIKGLLREAAENIHALSGDLVSQSFINEVFGFRTELGFVSQEETPASTCFFSNAHLSPALEQQLLQDGDHRYLYQVLSSTQLDENGVAKNKSLRQLEVSIPLTLYASIEDFPEADGKTNYREQMEYCMQWIKQLGLNRSRGLGRCKFSML